LVNIIPRTTDIAAVVYLEKDNRLVATDGESFALDINEFGRLR
jgi:hypothetical protein